MDGNELKTIVFVLALGFVAGCRQQAEPSELANHVANALAAKDWPTVAEFVHPEHGLRFTPSAYIRLDGDVVLSKQEVRGLGTDRTVRLWGQFDGSGDPIEMTIEEYYGLFIYDRDFARANIGASNEQLGRGNSLNNILEVFGEREVVFFERHVPGTTKYDGMDWGSLRLVLERANGQWYLIGIVHDEWTI